VVANGLTTKNVWEPLAANVSQTDLQRYWSPISPFPYVAKLSGAGKKILLITGRYDPTFWPEFTDDLLKKLQRERVDFEGVSLPCGHYSMGERPFRYIAGYRFGKFLRRALA
jgi:hypothetical protein